MAIKMTPADYGPHPEQYLVAPGTESCYEYLHACYNRIRKDLGDDYIAFMIPVADKESAVKLIEENSELICVTVEQAERDRIIRNIKKYEELKLAPVVTEMVGGSPHFPSGYKLKKRSSDFIWIEYAIQDVTQ